jgi:hypothetical protein
MPPLTEDDVPVHAYYTKLALQSAVVVVCTAENIDNHVPEHYESTTAIEQMKRERQQVIDNYTRMAHDLPGVITYDFKVRSFESLIREIDGAISIRL